VKIACRTLLLLALASTPAAAAVVVWDGGANSDQWTSQGSKNWEPNGQPANTDDLVFGSGPYSTVDLDGDRTANSVTFQSGSGSFTLYNNILSLTAGLAQDSGSLQTISSALALAGTTSVSVTSTGNMVLSGAITETGGARTLTKTGTGTGKLVLGGTAANTFSGGLVISQGVVEAQKTSALGTGAATIASGAALELSGGIAPTNTITLGGIGVGGTGAIRNLSGANTVSGALTLSSAARVQSDAGTLTLSGAIGGAGNSLTVGGSGNTLISGVIGTGTGGLIKDGAGTLTLSGANSYTGGTTISAGTIALGAADRLADTGNVSIGATGTLDLAGFSERIHDLAASNGATLDFGATSEANTFLFDTFTAPVSGVLVVNNWESVLDNLATTVNGQASVSSIYFSGLGVAAYNGTATLYGGVRYLLKPVTAVEKEWNGTVGNAWSAADHWTSANKPGTAEIALFDSLGVSRADVTLDGDNTIAGIAFGTGATVGYTISGASTLTLTGTVPYIQQRSTSNQTLAMNTLQIDGNTVADITGTGNLVIDSAITETGGSRRLIRDGTGSGKLVLGGASANTYSGGLFINTGRVEAQKSSALGTGAATIASGAALELSGGIAPTNALTLGGTGVGGNGAIRNLSGNNTLSGALTLSNNTRLQSDAGILTVSGGVSGSGLNLNVGGVADTVISGVIATGAGNVSKDGAGVLTLSGANTYTGTTTISGGSVKLGVDNRLADTSALALAGGTLNLNGFSEQVGNLAVSADSNIDFGTAGTNNNFLFAAFSATPSGVLSIYNWERGSDFLASSASLTVDELSAFYFVGYGTGASQLTSQTISGYGAGWRPLDAALIEWYTWDSGAGTNRWDSGANWTQASNDNKTPATNAWVAFGTGGQTSVDLRANRTVNGMRFDAAGSGSFDIGAGQANTLTFSGAVASSVAFIQQNSASNQSLTMSTVALSRNTVVDMAGAGNLTISSALTGTGNLVKENTGGKLILSGASTAYAGGVFINNGVLQITANDALGNTTAATTVAANATLELTGAAITSAENIGLSGAGFSSGGAIRSLTGTNTLSGTLTLAADSRINADAGTLTLSNAVTGSAKNLTLGGAGNITVSGVITTGTGTVAKDGAGTLTYSGATANTYTGTTTVSGGTLVLGKTAGVNALAGNLVIGDGTGTDTVRLDQSNQIVDTAALTLNTGGVFNVNGLTETIAGLSSAAAGSQVQLGAGTLTVANATANTYAGAITGSGGLTKTGAGRLTLSGSNAGYSGTTTVNAGQVAVQAATALGTGAVNVTSGGNVEIQNNITVANAFTLAGDGGVAQDGAIENLSGNNTLTGNITLGANARISSNSGTFTLNTGTLTGANRNLTVGGSGDTVMNRNINIGTGTLTKEGGGNLTLGVANSYTGGTTISGGKIIAGATGIFSDAAALTIDTGAVYDMAGNSETIGSLQSAAGVGGSITFDGATLTLAGGASSFGGDFGFSNGTIVINAGQSLTLTDAFNAANINIILNGGSLFLGNGLTHTFGTLLVNGATSSVIDFGTSGSTVAQFSSVNVTGAGALSVSNWTDYVDYFLSTATTGAQGVSPNTKIVFAGFSGSDTKWAPLTGGGQLTPVPEPSTYGALLLGGATGLVFWVRSRRRPVRSTRQ